MPAPGAAARRGRSGGIATRPRTDPGETLSAQPHALVVGAGVVGICCALHLRRAGFAVTVCDPAAPGSLTSSGNAGGFAVTEVVPLAMPGIARHVPRWLFDPLGPLAVRWSGLGQTLPWLWRFARAGTRAQLARSAGALAALLRPTFTDWTPLWRDAGVADSVVSSGALTVYPDRQALAADRLEWRIRLEHGIECEMLDGVGVRRLEPALSPSIDCGVFTPAWRHTLDPYRMVTALAELAWREGARLRAERVGTVEFARGRPRCVRLSGGDTLDFDWLVIAAGVWSRTLAEALERVTVPLVAERGYNTTLPHPGVEVQREVIFARDKFVMTPMAAGLRIGGAAEFAAADAAPDWRRARALVRLATRYLPGLDTSGGEPWMGRRPSTPDSLPVIARSPRHANVLYAFGHGHLGLTQAATTGRLIAGLARGERTSPDVAPYSLERFSSLR